MIGILRRKRNEDGSLGEYEKIGEGETSDEKVTRLQSELLTLQEYIINKEMEDLIGGEF